MSTLAIKQKAQALYDRGLSLQAIADELGVAKSTAHSYVNDRSVTTERSIERSENGSFTSNSINMDSSRSKTRSKPKVKEPDYVQTLKEQNKVIQERADKLESILTIMKKSSIEALKNRFNRVKQKMKEFDNEVWTYDELTDIRWELEEVSVLFSNFQDEEWKFLEFELKPTIEIVDQVIAEFDDEDLAEGEVSFYDN